MKKIWSILLILVLVAIVASAAADVKVVNGLEERNIAVQPAGENQVDKNISPTTGRDLDDLADTDLPEGFLGMAATGKYYPVMVQHCGYAAATGDAAPLYGSYADVYYEMAKSKPGHARMGILYNDYHPTWVGASRSMRVGYLWIRQEWNAPYIYAGYQTDDSGNKYNTDVNKTARALGLVTPENPEPPLEERVLFNALNGGTRAWLNAVHRIKGKGMSGKSMTDNHNLVWKLTYLDQNVFNKDLEFPNHTWKFTDSLPEGGDEATTVYIRFNKNANKSGGEEDGAYYFNSFLEYDADENVYYRYAIRDGQNPQNKAILFQEQIPSNVQGVNGKDSDYRISCTLSLGNAITFANVIVQGVHMEWPNGDETPYPFMTGTGVADYFMGGKHYTGVWKRDTYDDRTVFYGEDGQEISMQRGRTLIVIMDYNTTYKGENIREVSYE